MLSVYVVVFVYSSVILFFFFKQKTAYEMRISDWSSDVCSSDLDPRQRAEQAAPQRRRNHRAQPLLAMLKDKPAIPRKRFVGAVPRQRDRHLFARQFADAIGRQRARIGKGFVEHVGDPVDQREIAGGDGTGARSEEHTSELQSLMRNSYAVCCLKKKKVQ